MALDYELCSNNGLKMGSCSRQNQNCLEVKGMLWFKRDIVY